MERHHQDQWRLHQTGVNLGGLYAVKAISESPTFVQHLQRDKPIEQQPQNNIHVALVSIRAPQLIDDQALSGLALTLSQLVRLDMQIVLTFDCDESSCELTSKTLDRQKYQRQADRIIKAIELHNNAGAWYVETALSVAGNTNSTLRSSVKVFIPKLIVEPLKRTSIVVVPALASTESFRTIPVDSADVMLALTHALSGVQTEVMQNSASSEISVGLPTAVTELDRIIMIDPLGGLPSRQREDGAHVFVNLEQEYDHIVDEYQRMTSNFNGSSTTKNGCTPTDSAKYYIRNLEILRNCLAVLPPASSALVISPQEAISTSQASSTGSDSLGIQTRRQKNPLIHNLLTNKPLISSSLPAARLSTPATKQPPHTTTAPTRSTLVKRGMPVLMIPDPLKQPWTPPQPGEPTISLENHPDINFPRLLTLIEDSFRRPLDVKAYLERIENRIAGVIIAGEYEGGAILTWEEPPSSTGSGDKAKLVPYLDKFAVLQRSQGSSGVADIVFQSMVRSCFPSGVCWRSRTDNPVNKWYFERSRGTWHLQGGQWTMFWTTDGLVEDKQRWEDYVAVCSGVLPTWADSKQPD